MDLRVEFDEPVFVPIIPDLFSIPLPKYVSLEVKRTPPRDGDEAETLVRVEAELGRAAHVHPGFSPLTLRLVSTLGYDELLSNFAFNFILRHYSSALPCSTRRCAR